MNALSKYLLYRELIKQLRGKSVAATRFDSRVIRIEWGRDRYNVQSFKDNTKYLTNVTTSDGQDIATFTGSRAQRLYTAAYWLSIEQAPSNELHAKMQIDRTAIDFAFDEIRNAEQKTR